VTESKGTLRVEGVSRDFVGLRALDDVSLELQRGEILGLIGPNGSGKTTLVNVITGVLAPTTGRVLADGVRISGSAPHRIARAGVARTFQSVRLFDTLTVRENVELGAISAGRNRKAARQTAGELLERFELSDLAHVLSGSLAYGLERMVEIARALATGCSFLLLDEPAAGLNEQESEELLGRLARIPAEFDLGMLIIDHDMNLIMRLCHRLHVLNQGRTIATGSADDIRSDPVVVEAYLGSQGAARSDAAQTDAARSDAAQGEPVAGRPEGSPRADRQ
jgi:branched-chain amino acid transport system ATP-binding protein